MLGAVRSTPSEAPSDAVFRLDSALSDPALLRQVDAALVRILGKGRRPRAHHDAKAFRWTWGAGAAEVSLEHVVATGTRRLTVCGAPPVAVEDALVRAVAVTSLQSLVDVARYRPRSVAAIDAMVELAPREAQPQVVRALWEALDDPDPRVAKAAMHACLALGWPELDAPLLTMAATDTPVGHVLRRGDDLLLEAADDEGVEPMAWLVLGAGVACFSMGVMTVVCAVVVALGMWLGAI